MKYEIKVWKDSSKIPKRLEPEKAANLIDNVKGAIGDLTGANPNDNKKPDIWIDEDGGGEDAIKSVKISYLTSEVNEGDREKLVRSIKLEIKGNLYLPLDEGLEGDAKKLIGINKGAENTLRNTLLFSEWAQVTPAEDRQKHYYRGIVVNVITKAGDFRLIIAKNVYVDSYSEDYKDGEFGTFEMTLVGKVDTLEDFQVKGLGSEKTSTLAKVAKVVSKAVEVVAVGAQAGKIITETVEKYTGETTATRWLKYGFDSAGTANKIKGSVSNIKKDPSGVTAAKEITNINKDMQERLQTATDNVKDVPLAQMEKMYLSWIQADPGKYEEYKKMNYTQKYAALEQAAKDMKARAGITKDMEQEEYDYYKRENEKK